MQAGNGRKKAEKRHTSVCPEMLTNSEGHKDITQLEGNKIKRNASSVLNTKKYPVVKKGLI